jgi:hypothetical protein
MALGKITENFNLTSTIATNTVLCAGQPQPHPNLHGSMFELCTAAKTIANPGLTGWREFLLYRNGVECPIF